MGAFGMFSVKPHLGLGNSWHGCSGGEVRLYSYSYKILLYIIYIISRNLRDTMVLSVQKKCITILIYIYIYVGKGFLAIAPASSQTCWPGLGHGWLILRSKWRRLSVSPARKEAQRRRLSRSKSKEVKFLCWAPMFDIWIGELMHIVFISTDASEQGIYFIYIYIFGYTSFYL